MKLESLMINKSTKLSTIFILFALGGVLSFITIHSLLFSDHAKDMALSNAIKKSLEREQFVKSFLNCTKNDLIAIKNSSSFIHYLNTKDTNDKKDINSILITIASTKKNISRIRYIDKNGQEIIRIQRDRPSRAPYAVQKTQLQNKSDRYYYKDSKHKKLNEIWFSSIDLNIERGSIVIPFKPTLRAIMPIGKDDKFDGVLVVNYFMKGFLDSLCNTPLYDMIVSNSQGYPIQHFKAEKSWGEHIMPKYNISQEFGVHTKDILSKDIYITNDFLSRRLDLPFNDDIILIFQLKKEYIQKQKDNRINQYIVVSIVLMLSAIIASFVVSYIVKRYKKVE